MFKKLFNALRHPWTISWVGLTCVLAIIWFAAPLVGFGKSPTYYPLEGVATRVILMVCAALSWFAQRLVRTWRAFHTNAQMLKSMAAADSVKSVDEIAKESKQQVDELRLRMEEALNVLKQSKIGGAWGHRYVYQLPWYVIIGAPGSGKTTALINSGIRFPLADRLGSGAVKGVGGTRNCDWWFTDEAVLLDTAGRYTTHDSNPEVDGAAWKGFLDLLKRYRKRRPINGVLMTVSIVDLLQQSREQRQAHAAQLKARIQELHKHFGIRFPVYALFTKCDLLAGFKDYFATFGREEREQVWGMTFPLNDTNDIADVMPTYAANYAALERRLSERVIARAHEEKDLQRRSALYEFPLQFGAFRELSERFLNEIFQITKFEERVMLRGVYFTSGTQEGTPIDRIMGSIAKNFSVDRAKSAEPVGAGKSYFVTRLLRELVFREAGLAGTNLKHEGQRRWLQRIAYAFAIVVTLVSSIAWLASYQNNRDYFLAVNASALEVKRALAAINVQGSSVASLLPVLDAVRSIPGGYGERAIGGSFWRGLGLYQGNKMGNEAKDAYVRSLAAVLLPQVARRLETQIRENGSDQSFAFEALRVYLMLDNPKQFDAKAIAAWLDFDWEQQGHAISAEQRNRLLLHTATLFENGVPIPGVNIDRALVENTRRALSQMTAAQRVYSQLKRLPEVQALPEYRLSDISGREGALVFTRKSGTSWGKGVPGLFTYDGYHKIFKDKIDQAALETSKDSWILGAYASKADQDKSKLSDDVRQLYLEEYKREWDRVLGDVTVVPFADMNRAALVLNVLSKPSDSPLRKLLQAVVRETQLHKQAPLGATEAELTQLSGLDAAKTKIADRLGRFLGAKPEFNALTSHDAPETVVNNHFARLHEFVDGGGKTGNAPPLDRTMTLLSDLNAYLGAAVSAIQSGQRPPPPTPQNAQTLQQIQQEAPRSPAPVRGVMSRVAEGTRAIVVSGSLLNADWRSSVLPLCKEGIVARYPFARNASQDVTREDFGLFFANSGTVDAFFQRNLKEFVDTNRDPWQMRSFDGARLQLSKNGLASLHDAAKIREVFFRGGGQTPTLSFELKPVTMDAGITRFSLDVDGQILRYDHGPQMAVPMRWPGPRGNGNVNLEFEPPGASGRKAITLDGPWALFRLFERARMQPTKDPARFEVAFDLEGKSVVLELRASSVVNPFRMSSLEHFQCPERL